MAVFSPERRSPAHTRLGYGWGGGGATTGWLLLSLTCSTEHGEALRGIQARRSRPTCSFVERGRQGGGASSSRDRFSLSSFCLSNEKRLKTSNHLVGCCQFLCLLFITYFKCNNFTLISCHQNLYPSFCPDFPGLNPDPSSNSTSNCGFILLIKGFEVVIINVFEIMCRMSIWKEIYNPSPLLHSPCSAPIS